jgi:drug/metabolite transporter (DMT)-like permease
LVLGVAAVARHLELPTGFAMRMALIAALLDTIGNVAMLLALRGSLLSLASVLVSLYPAATVVLAVVVLRERAHRLQVVGMALALVSVAMIAGG